MTEKMAVLLLVAGGLVGLAAATIAWLLGAHLFTILLTYAISGNLAFTLLSAMLSGGRPDDEPRDFTAEIEADLQALLEERYARLHQAEEERFRWCPVLRRGPSHDTKVPAKERRLFRGN